MPNSLPRLSKPGIALVLVSAAFMLHTLTVHPQSRSESSTGKTQESGQEKATSGASSAASGAASAGTGKLSRADEKLMTEIAQANLAEISTGKLAQDKSKNDQVKSFAQKMVDDHTKALDDLKQLAQAKGVSLPTEPDRQQKAMETQTLLKQASTKAQDTDLKNYASKTMGVVESHQQMAEETERNMKSSSHGKSGSGSTGSGTSGTKSPSSTGANQ